MSDIAFRTTDIAKIDETADVSIYTLKDVMTVLFKAGPGVLHRLSGGGKIYSSDHIGGFDHATAGQVWVYGTGLMQTSHCELTKY